MHSKFSLIHVPHAGNVFSTHFLRLAAQLACRSCNPWILIALESKLVVTCTHLYLQVRHPVLSCLEPFLRCTIFSAILCRAGHGRPVQGERGNWSENKRPCVETLAGGVLVGAA